MRRGVNINPYDLRRHAATFASRSGTPIEIVSKVILRHASLSTTQRYLGKVSDAEALRWIENDLFVHYSNIDAARMRSLEEGKKVEYEVGQDRKGPEATKIRPIA